jgi:serine/threonine-protein kinase
VYNVRVSDRAPSSPDSDPMIGTVLNETYRLERKIGEGGMAVVYEAAHTRVERRFAIKVLQVKATAIPDVLTRFEREARIGSQLGHDHIVQVFDFNRTPQGEPYLVMELLEGADLSALLHREQWFPLDWTMAMIRQVASALDAAHENGVVHRDIKPENIFLCGEPRSRVKATVMDFGISKVLASKTFVTRDSQVFGTPWYMAPEQAQGRVKEIDQRTDIYALGVILYRMLGGKLPFEGPTIPSVLYQIVHEAPDPLGQLQPDLPRELIRIVERAMHKEPDRRYQAVTEMVSDLERAMGPWWSRVLAWGQAAADRTITVEWSSERRLTLPGPSALETQETLAPDPGQPRPAKLPAPAATTRRPLLAALFAGVVLIIGAAIYLLAARGGTTPPVADAGPDRPDLAPAVASIDAGPSRVAVPDGWLTNNRSLSIRSTPEGATVMVNGRPVGRTPIEGLPVPRTTLTITISKEGRAKVIRVQAGSASEQLQVDLN